MRIEVWDDTAKGWFTLHARVSTVEVDGLEPFEVREEGWIQGGTVQETHGVDDGKVYVHEQLFGWSGWSLSAPHPALALEHTYEGSQDPDDPERNERLAASPPRPADPPLHVVTISRVAKGTLPRLRYGRSYALRAWAVDLAGASPAHTVSTTRKVRESRRGRCSTRPPPGSPRRARRPPATTFDALVKEVRASALSAAALDAQPARRRGARHRSARAAADVRQGARAGRHGPARPAARARRPAHARRSRRSRSRRRAALAVQRAVAPLLSANVPLVADTAGWSAQSLAARDRRRPADPRPARGHRPAARHRHAAAPAAALASRRPAGARPARAVHRGRVAAPPRRAQRRHDGPRPRARRHDRADRRRDVGGGGERRAPRARARIPERLRAPRRAAEGQPARGRAAGPLRRRDEPGRRPGRAPPRGARRAARGRLVPRPHAPEHRPRRPGRRGRRARRAARRPDRLARPVQGARGPRARRGAGSRPVRHPRGRGARCVPYLPDPMVRGVSMVFPDAGRDRPLRPPISIEGTTADYLAPERWPEVAPYRIVFEPGRPLGADVDGRTINVSLPPADMLRVRLSSSLRPRQGRPVRLLARAARGDPQRPGPARGRRRRLAVGADPERGARLRPRRAQAARGRALPDARPAPRRRRHRRDAVGRRSTSTGRAPSASRSRRRGPSRRTTSRSRARTTSTRPSATRSRARCRSRRSRTSRCSATRTSC